MMKLSHNYLFLYMLHFLNCLDIYVNNSFQNTTYTDGSLNSPFLSLNYGLKTIGSSSNQSITFLIVPTDGTPYIISEQFNIRSNITFLSIQTGIKVQILFHKTGSFFCQNSFSLILKDIQIVMNVFRDFPQFFILNGNILS